MIIRKEDCSRWKTVAECNFGGTLTGIEIYNQVKSGGIIIEPFNPNQINPNSYNVRLGRELKVYTEFPLDFKKTNPTKTLEIPDEGCILGPGILYLGTTVERVFTDKFKPCINGRSSGGRLGIDIHKCAGFGDIGFDGTWTLEIEVVHPTIVYPDLEIAQISFDTVVGDTTYQYNGRYNKQNGTTASRVEENKKGSFTDVLKYLELKKDFENLINNNKIFDLMINKAYAFDVSYKLYDNEYIGFCEGNICINDHIVIGGIYPLNNGKRLYIRPIYKEE